MTFHRGGRLGDAEGTLLSLAGGATSVSGAQRGRGFRGGGRCGQEPGVARAVPFCWLLPVTCTKGEARLAGVGGLEHSREDASASLTLNCPEPNTPPYSFLLKHPWRATDPAPLCLSDHHPCLLCLLTLWAAHGL